MEVTMKLNLIIVLGFLFISGILFAANNAVEFDGIDDHVQVTSPLGIGNTYTVEGWIYPTSLTSTVNDIPTFGRTVFSASATIGVFPFWLTVYGPNIIIRSWTTTALGRTINAGLTTNQWYHIAVTSTKGGLTKTYLNGVQIDSYTNGNLTTWPSSFTIGAIRPFRNLSNLPFQGLIDEVRVWNTVRSANDILADMSRPISPIPTDLVGYWKFDESHPDTIAKDSAGTQQNGTLANGARFTASDLTLPVELSSFTAILMVDNLVKIAWISQSETALLGYYVFRSNTPVLNEAICISALIDATNSSSATSYSFVDQDIAAGNTWYYWLQSIDFDGSFNYHGPVSVYVSGSEGSQSPGVPVLTELHPIYPNPFNPDACIGYGVASPSAVKVQIFNSRGQLVRSYDEGYRQIGNYRIIWNGRDNGGRELSSGIYHIRLEAGTEIHNQKAVLAK